MHRYGGGGSLLQLNGSAPIFSPRSAILFIVSLMKTPGCGGTQSLGTATNRTSTVEDALLALARLCLLTYHVQGTVVTRLPTPDARQKAILDALGTPLPPARSLRQM